MHNIAAARLRRKHVSATTAAFHELTRSNFLHDEWQQGLLLEKYAQPGCCVSVVGATANRLGAASLRWPHPQSNLGAGRQLDLRLSDVAVAPGQVQRAVNVPLAQLQRITHQLQAIAERLLGQVRVQ